MARFPSREAEMAALAGTMVHGLAEHAEDFPDGVFEADKDRPCKDVVADVDFAQAWN